MDGDTVECPIVCVSIEGVLQAPNENRKSPLTLEVSLELISASREVNIQVIDELCQRLPDCESQLYR